MTRLDASQHQNDPQWLNSSIVLSCLVTIDVLKNTMTTPFKKWREMNEKRNDKGYDCMCVAHRMKLLLWILYTAQSSSSSSTTASAGNASLQQQSCNSVGVGNNSNGNSSTSFGGGRYHHREVPPRFQHHKQNKGPKHSSKTNQGIAVVILLCKVNSWKCSIWEQAFASQKGGSQFLIKMRLS